MSVAVVCLFKLRQIIALTSLHNQEARMELDTHADTTVLGRNCLLSHDFDKTVSVTGWDASAGATKCRTVSGVVAYNHPVTGQAYMLVFYQAIYM